MIVALAVSQQDRENRVPMQMVCLANSRKLMGRCIAGKQRQAGKAAGRWIRPVSQRENQEVSEYERQYQDGSDPRVLDIMEVPLLGARPAGHQPENWLLDPRLYWKKIGIHSLRDLPALVDPVHPLWLDGFSTYHGINDRIPVEMASEAGDSLRLISVNKIELRVLAPGEAFGNSKRRVQGRFIHADQR